MRPIQIVLFLLSVLGGLLLLVFFAPDLVRYTGCTKLSYPSMDQFSFQSHKEKSLLSSTDSVWIDSLLESNTESFFPPDSLAADSLVLASDTSRRQVVEKKETLVAQPKRAISAPKEPVSIRREQVESIDAVSLLKKGQPIEYPDQPGAIMNPFFDALSGLATSNELIRILHYGDSQIEGDRISSYIRNRFQKEFGGSGIGLFPVQEMKDNNISIQLTTSDNWQHVGIRDYKDIPESHQQYGILTGFSRYNDFSDYRSQKHDSYEAWIRVVRQSFSYPLSRSFKRFRVFYAFNQAPLITQMTSNGVSLDADIIEPSFGLQVLEWQFDETPNAFELHFQGEDSPDIFAISLDGDQGVALDNISLRGSSGLEFTKTNRQFYREMYKQLNVKMVLLQFGVNVAPHVVDNYYYYEKKLYQQLLYLKQLNPGLTIVVMGISDIARRTRQGYASYPNVELIRDAQRRAAFRAGCAFWDVYEAMGGENAMVHWVFSDPPLAVPDFIHFNHQGAVLLAEMFYNALILDYQYYKQRF